MLNYLIVILEQNATSFCCYASNDDQNSNLIPLESLKEVIDYAIKNRTFISFLFGNSVLPFEYSEVIETVEHIKIMSLDNHLSDDNALIIIDADKINQQISFLKNSDLSNIILRVGSNNLKLLYGIVKKLIGKFKRLNIILKNVDTLEELSFDMYHRQLEQIRILLENEYRNGNFVEISVISDRLFLTTMNNCGAGCDHITLAPNGKFYLCPAFYYDNSDNSIGTIKDMENLKNSPLLELASSPICRTCDAYHCKRCIYLNKKLTSELNTPSSQQCTLAHIERNISRKFLETLKDELPGAEKITSIPEIDYLDPFTIISSPFLSLEDKEKHFAELLSKPLENVPVKQLLLQIYKTDPELLTKLKNLNYSGVDLANTD